MKIPVNIGIIHFIGIGGIGMSGIAEMLYRLGYKIQGSDQKENANTKRLQNLGIKIYIGHLPQNIADSEVVVISTAVKTDNIEYIAAKQKNLPVVRRAEMLAELMRFKRCIAVGGTHGKTTTTSMVAALLAAGGHDPTIINGGIINEYGSNAVMGQGEWMVVEADESDGSFLKLPADIAAITNIDPEHLDYYGSFDRLEKAFLRFIENIPFYGFAVLCIDHPNIRNLITKIHNRRIITYGAAQDAMFRFVPKKQHIDAISARTENIFDVIISGKNNKPEQVIEDLVITMPGVHNISNATAAIAIALELGIDIADIRNALQNFSGVKRRFTYVGSWNGAAFFDDYGHHPSEIKSVLQAAKKSCQGKVIAVMQPHRYSRLNDLFADFVHSFTDADMIFITPVYAAGEVPIEGANSYELCKEINLIKGKNCYNIENIEDLKAQLVKNAMPQDYVIFLGAGDITHWARNIVTLLPY